MNNKKNNNETDKQQQKHEDKIIFAPMEEIKNIETVIDKLRQTRDELQKVAASMKGSKAEQ